MVTRDTAWRPGTPCWADLSADDVDRARAFYSGLFGWNIPPGPPEAGGYSMGEMAGRAVAGIGPKMGAPDAPVGGSYQAKIVVVDQMFDAASNTIGVRLELPNPDLRLPAGVHCHVRLSGPS